MCMKSAVWNNYGNNVHVYRGDTKNQRIVISPYFCVQKFSLDTLFSISNVTKFQKDIHVPKARLNMCFGLLVFEDKIYHRIIERFRLEQTSKII